jgi:hypothetical protein
MTSHINTLTPYIPSLVVCIKPVIALDACGNGDIAIHGGGMKQKVVQLREL